jgi:GNAT superfamily N-acetyltransferase
MTGWQKPDIDRLFASVDATWPPHRIWQQGGWSFRDGRGGGKRVSAATLAGPAQNANTEFAAQVMAEMDQPDLFMIRPQDAVLDQKLAGAGYEIIDPVTVLIAPLSEMPSENPARAPLFSGDPTDDMVQVWQAGGIGQARLDIMRRCALPKTCVALVEDGQTAAVAFAACDDGLVMCHAVEVLGPFRRRGLGRDIMLVILGWARSQQAQGLSVLTTRANTAALSLYGDMGMTEASGYHYRIRQY